MSGGSGRADTGNQQRGDGIEHETKVRITEAALNKATCPPEACSKVPMPFQHSHASRPVFLSKIEESLMAQMQCGFALELLNLAVSFR
jgi:hypothetical protein